MSLWLCLPIFLICFSIFLPARGKEGSESSGTAATGRLQHVVDELRARLSVAHEVAVSVVPENPLMVSVGSADGRPDAYVLSFDERFMAALSTAELEAAIAHELGHVWIFTHHPYLHTEALANRIAMRVVSRTTLETVYQKMWARNGSKGDLARFLGK